jgi:hypothetical protein
MSEPTDPVALDLTAVVAWRADVAQLIARMREGDQVAPFEAKALLDHALNTAHRVVDQAAPGLTTDERVRAIDALWLVVLVLGNLWELSDTGDDV